MSLQRLVYLDGQQAVIYKGLKHNASLRRNFETMTQGDTAPTFTTTMPMAYAVIAPPSNRESHA